MVVAVAAGVALVLAGIGSCARHDGGDTAVSGASTHQNKQHAPENAADLNGDGHPDEVFTSFRGTAGHGGHGVPYLAVVYGPAKGPNGEERAVFSERDLGRLTTRTAVPGDQPPAVAGLDEDGHPDVVASRSAAVVWGGPKGPRKGSAHSHIALPKRRSVADDDRIPPVVGDFDGDGHMDVAAARDSDEETGAPPRLVVLHGRDEGLYSTAWRETKRQSSAAGDKGNHYGGQLYGARDYDGDGKDELAVADNLAEGPKAARWYTGGTDKDDVTFTTEALRARTGTRTFRN